MFFTIATNDDGISDVIFVAISIILSSVSFFIESTSNPSTIPSLPSVSSNISLTCSIILGIVFINSFICSDKRGISPPIIRAIRPSSITYVTAVPIVLLIPLFCSHFTSGSNSHAIINPMNSGAITFSIVMINSSIFISFVSLIIAYMPSIINSMYSILTVFLERLISSFNFFLSTSFTSTFFFPNIFFTQYDYNKFLCYLQLFLW